MNKSEDSTFNIKDKIIVGDESLEQEKNNINNLEENINNEDDSINLINEIMGTEQAKIEKKTDDEDYIVGIDLGTTNSCVGIWRNNNLEIIPDEHGNNTIPSYVGFTSVNRYVGLEAKNQKELNPKNVFYEFKRLIGRKMNDDSVIDDSEFLNYDILPDENNNICVKTEFDKVITPEELSSIILTKLKTMASAYLKKEVTKAVITVPAYFNDAQRQATKDAARIAGLECVRIINEPTAAALTYGLLNKSVSKKNNGDPINVIVYDIGGGTVDISLLIITDGLFEVKASVGNTHLGGADFDNKIISYCINYFKKVHKYDKLENLSSLSYQKLKKSCENAKKILSTSLKTNIMVHNFHDGKDLIIHMTREKLTEICRDLLILCLKPLEDILESTQMKKEEINEVILVGGMTRMPQIINNIKNFFNGKEPNCSMNPDEVVAAGASIQGYLISHGDDPFSENITLLDIIPLSLGVETIGGVMHTLIPRNTIIPITKKGKYTTDSDNETSVIIKVFEGERKMTKDNFFVGEFELDGLEPAPRGYVKINVTFNIDINGIITVSAEDVTDKEKTGNKKAITITGNKGRLKNEQIEKLIRESKDYELNDKIMKKKREFYYEIDNVISNITKNLNDEELKLHDKDREKLENDLVIYKKWLKEKKYVDREEEEFKSVHEELSKKFGTLILRASKGKNVDAIGEKVKATTVYGSEKEDQNLDGENFDSSILEDTELGITELDEEERKEIKSLKNSLIELSHSIFELLNDNKKIEKEDKNKIIEFIDDALLWSYTVEKPKKHDFIEKINNINDECNKLFDKYKDILEKEEITNSIEELEKICISLRSSMMCGLFSFKKEHVDLINSKLDQYLLEIAEYKFEEYKLENKIDNKIEKIKNDFIEKCKKYIDDINKTCSDIEAELMMKHVIKNMNLDEVNENENKNNSINDKNNEQNNEVKTETNIVNNMFDYNNMEGTDISTLMAGYNNE